MTKEELQTVVDSMEQGEKLTLFDVNSNKFYPITGHARQAGRPVITFDRRGWTA